jgi:hypothetical protein
MFLGQLRRFYWYVTRYGTFSTVLHTVSYCISTGTLLQSYKPTFLSNSISVGTISPVLTFKT